MQCVYRLYVSSCVNSLNYQHCKSMPFTRTFDEVSTEIKKGWRRALLVTMESECNNNKHKQSNAHNLQN